MPDIIVEIGFAAGATTQDYLFLGDPLRGVIGTNTLAPDAVLFDVTDDVRGFSVQRGSSRTDPVTRSEAGTSSTVLKDATRKYDPTNLSGPFVVSGVSEVVPMVVVRHRATWNGTTYDVWRGFADSWAIGYSKKGNYTEVTLTATDAFKVLQANKRTASASVGAGETSGARITRILNSASWSASDRIIATGNTTLQPTILEGDPLQEAQLVSDTEIGDFYIDAAGRAVFRHRYAVQQDTRSSVSQATFGDNPGELQYQEIAVEYDEQLLVNEAKVTRVGGVEQTRSDTASQVKYLIHTYERGDLLMQTDALAKDYAAFLILQNANPELRFASITIDPRRDPDNLYPQVLGRELGDRITINLRPDSGDPISREVFIRGISHEVTRTSWRTTWTLQTAEHWTFFQLDSATLGVLDTGVLGY